MERPKILTEVTVPTGGWAFGWGVNDTAGWDSGTSTIPAGTYFVAADFQSDDLLWKLCDLVTDAVVALGGTYAEFYMRPWIIDRKVSFFCRSRSSAGSVSVRFEWGNTNASLLALLGHIGTSNEDLTEVSAGKRYSWTADYHHAYGWYASKDGYLRDAALYDIPSVQGAQSRSLGGQVKTLQISEYLYDNAIDLYGLTRTEYLSGGVGYTVEPPYPIEHNRPLECWWREAIQGKRFRFYRNDPNRIAFREASFIEDAVGSLGPEHGGVFSVAPYAAQYEGLAVMCEAATDSVSGTDWPHRHHIDAADATSFDAANDIAGYSFSSDGTQAWYIIDGSYQTYVLNRAAMPSFPQAEVSRGTDLFAVNIPVMRYVA